MKRCILVAFLCSFFVFPAASAAGTVCQIGNGCTGTSTTPAYGQVLIGGKNGEYEFVASSTFGGSGGAGGSGFSTTSANYWLTQQTTGSLAEGSNLYYTLTRWASALAGTTTDALSEGANHLYFTTARAIAALTGQNVSIFNNDAGYLTSATFNSSFDSRLTATTSLPKITTLAGLSLPYSQLTGAPTSMASSTLLANNNTFSGSNTFSQTISGSINGNANTATTLQSSRTINNVAFNGSANITINAASSSALSDSNTFSGADSFTNASSVWSGKIGSLSGLIGSVSGAPYAVSTSSIALGTITGATWAGNVIGSSYGGAGTVSGILKANGSGTVSAAANGTDFTLISANTCSAGQHVSAIAANGTVTCSADSGTTYTGTWPVAVSGSVVSWAGLATSSGLTAGRVHYSTGAGTFADVATSSLTVDAPLTTSGTLGYFVNGSAPHIGCQTASGSQAGCLSSTDWTTFNGKQAAYANLTSIGSLANGAGYLYNNGSGAFSYATPGSASTTLLSDSNSFTGRNAFSLLKLAATSSALLSADGNGVIVATSSVGTNLLTGSLGTINTQQLSVGGSITVTAASSTLLADNSTFSGTDSFTNSSSNWGGTWQSHAPSYFQTALGSLTGLIAGNAGAFYGVSTSSPLNTSITGNAGTVTNGVYTIDTGTVTNTMLAGSIANAKLANSAITINGSSVALGTSVTVSSTTLLANNNTFSGNNIFTASTTHSAQVNLQGASSTLFTAANGFWASGLVSCNSASNALTWSAGSFGCNTISGSGSGVGTVATSALETTGQVAVFSTTSGYPAKLYSQATSTPSIGSVLTYSGTLGSFVGGTSGSFSIANSSVTNAMLANSSITINGTGVSLGNSITVSSTTLLANNNTFSGNAIFTASTTHAAQLNLQGASSTLFSASNIWDSALTSGNCVQASANGLLTTTGSACGGSSSPQLPTIIVAASGGNTTSIQTALTTCGALGGGNIYLLDATYAQGTTGLTWRGSNCHIIGRGVGTTTITFTGATTLFKTNSPASQYSNDSIDGLTITADTNASGVGIDMSDMSHSVYSNIDMDSVATPIKINDTQNITFYNEVHNFQATTVTGIGVNASSTNPVNANRFINVFIGCNANCTALQMDNGNNNYFESFQAEPSTVTGTVGISLFDNKLATNDGVFDNQFVNSYIEANGTGIKIAASVNGSGGGVQRNIFNGGIADADTTDLNVADYSKNTFIGFDNNFGSPLTNFQGPVTVNGGIQTALFSIIDQGFANVAQYIANNTSFAHNSLDFIKYALLNGTDSSNLLNLSNAGTGATLIATSSRGTDFIISGSNGSVAAGSSTPIANFQATTPSANATTTFEIGKKSQNKGSCLKLYRTDGSAIYAYVAAGATTFTLSTTACASVSGF